MTESTNFQSWTERDLKVYDRGFHYVLNGLPADLAIKQAQMDVDKDV